MCSSSQTTDITSYIMETNFTLDRFHWPYSEQSVEVQLQAGVPVTEGQLRRFPAFKNWLEALKENLALQYTREDHAFSKDPYTLRSIKVQSVDWFTSSLIGFVKLKAEIRNEKSESSLPGIAFLRGGSVAVLMILRPTDSLDERWVVMTEQPRIPAGSLSFLEIPAGMMDGECNFAGAAAKEIREETGLVMKSSELINLTELALRQSKAKEDNLQNAMYPSPGGSDEFISIFLWEKVGMRPRTLKACR
jgi:ADP-sugar diphosphatase